MRYVASVFATEKGYFYKRAEAIAVARNVYRIKAEYRTEEEMAQDPRNAQVKTMRDYGFTVENYRLENMGNPGLIVIFDKVDTDLHLD